MGGELLASAAVVGNQVFVGAHGSGEFDALTLDSGTVGFRIRVPDWIHHEPVVTADLVIVAFGNNETNLEGHVGTDPSGIAAYDRRTGIERWYHYTARTAMTSPVIDDSIVAITSGREAIGWRVTDGKELWRTTLPSAAPMGNPLLIDTVMFVGLEPATICALNVRTGQGLFCSREANWAGGGGGHASLSSAGKTVLHVSAQGVPLAERIHEGWWRYALASLLRLPGADDPRDGIAELEGVRAGAPGTRPGNRSRAVARAAGHRQVRRRIRPHRGHTGRCRRRRLCPFAREWACVRGADRLGAGALVVGCEHGARIEFW